MAPMETSTLAAMQFLPRARVVAVDNNQDQLDSIARGLNAIGLPCVSMLYDASTGLGVPAQWVSAHVRIMFLDLNLMETDTTNLTALVDPIAEVLKSISPKGPYLLIFWTKFRDSVNEFMSIFHERKPDACLPFAVSSVDKAPFIENKDGGLHDTEALKAAILPVLSKNKLFLALLGWESITEGAAVETVNGLHRLVACAQQNGTAQDNDELVLLLRGMANAAWGKSHAQERPGSAVNSGLAPILLDLMDSGVALEHYRELWNDVLNNGNWSGRLPQNVSPGRLNCHCLVDKHCDNPTDRGAWLEFNGETGPDDGIFEKYFGCQPKVLREEFINPQRGNNGDDVLGSVKLAIVECTAACDYANNKAPLRRYILGARIHVDFADKIDWGNRKVRHDAIHEIETVEVDGAQFVLFLDFKYVLSLVPADPLLRDHVRLLFRIRTQVVADMLARFAAYTTRPGIYSLRGNRGQR